MAVFSEGDTVLGNHKALGWEEATVVMVKPDSTYVLEYEADGSLEEGVRAERIRELGADAEASVAVASSSSDEVEKEWRVVDAPSAAESSSAPLLESVAAERSKLAITGQAPHAKLKGKGRWTEYTLEDVAKHNNKEDCWIVVDDIVYDMSPHVRNHEGWSGSGKVSTLIALLAAMGLDCTDDFYESHGPEALRMMPSFQVGVLNTPNTAQVKRVKFLTWEQLVESGRVDGVNEPSVHL